MEKDKKFTVKCDEENNPQSVIDSNELVVNVSITPNWPTYEELGEYTEMMGEIDSWHDSDKILGIDSKPLFETKKEQDKFIEAFNAKVTEEIKKYDKDRQKKKRM